MNAPRRSPTEDELDQLLASRIQDTTPEFERRWVDLQRDLRLATAAAPRGRRWSWTHGWGGALVALGGLAAITLLLTRPAPVPSRVVETTPPFSAAFVELMELNEVLDQALPLIDAENRDALLYLPVDPASQS